MMTTRARSGSSRGRGTAGKASAYGSIRIPSRVMDLDELRVEVNRGDIDTVLLALTDMQGRLQGKRLVASFFLDEIAEHGAEGCNYLLAVDVDMSTVEGYAM